MPLSRIKPQMESSQLRLDSSAASTDVNERVLLNGVDSSSTGDGYAVILEDATANAFDGGPFVLSEAPISVANPSFKVTLSAPASASHSTYTKIPFDRPMVNIGGYYDNTTNYRFQPQIAGYYQLNLSVMEYSNLDVYDYILEIRLNGNSISTGRNRQITPGVTNEDIYASVVTVADIIHLNGTTDYVEGFWRAISEEGSGTMVVYGAISNSHNCYFSGTLLQRTS